MFGGSSPVRVIPAARNTPSVTSTDSDVAAWIQAVGQQNTFQDEVDRLTTFATAAKAALGISTFSQALDRIFLRATASRAASRVCLATRQTLSEVNNPSWTALLGDTGNGSGYLNFNWAPSSGPNAAAASMCVGFAAANFTTPACGLGGGNGSSNTIIYANDASHVTFAVNTSAGANDAIATVGNAGRWHAEVTGANAKTLYRNGVSVGTSTKGNGALPSFNMVGLAWSNTGVPGPSSSGVIGLYWMGKAMGAGVAGWDSAAQALMNSINSAQYA